MTMAYCEHTPTYAEVAAIKAGLPIEHAGHLRGETYEELLQDAKWLKSQYRPDAPPLGNPDARPDPHYDPVKTQMQRYAAQFARALEEADSKPGFGWKPLLFD